MPRLVEGVARTEDEAIAVLMRGARIWHVELVDGVAGEGWAFFARCTDCLGDVVNGWIALNNRLASESESLLLIRVGSSLLHWLHEALVLQVSLHLYPHRLLIPHHTAHVHSRGRLVVRCLEIYTPLVRLHSTVLSNQTVVVLRVIINWFLKLHINGWPRADSSSWIELMAPSWAPIARIEVLSLRVLMFQNTLLFIHPRTVNFQRSLSIWTLLVRQVILLILVKLQLLSLQPL